MASLTVENYLKAILLIEQDGESPQVSTGQLADSLGLSPGSVTSMLKTLSDSKLVTYKPYAGVKLTKAGRHLAVRIVRRHRLLELFLVKTLNLSWDQVHEEAEHMEHAVSDFLIDRIDEFLDHPSADPHGDPIPSADGVMRRETDSAISLTEVGKDQRVKVVRVTNQGSGFLKFLSDSGVDLGIKCVVEQNSEAAGVVSLRIGDQTVSVGHAAAECILVEPLAVVES